MLGTKATILPPQALIITIYRKQFNYITDGKYISFVGADTSGTIKLWLGQLIRYQHRPLTKASNAAYPFWSPDSKEIAYLIKIS